MASGEFSVYDFLAELNPEIRAWSERTTVYQRYVFERARLEKMAGDAFAETGRFTNDKVARQKTKCF